MTTPSPFPDSFREKVTLREAIAQGYLIHDNGGYRWPNGARPPLKREG